MATPINPVPDFSQYNFQVGDTTEVVTKQNGVNATLEKLGRDINTTVESVNQDVQNIEQYRQGIDPAKIVHAPGSGLPNTAGTAYSRDAANGYGDTTAGRLISTNAGPAQAFRRGNILGPVSISNGIPTGAIIESDSNDDGEWVKLANRTMITLSVHQDGGVATQEGALYRSQTVLCTYPRPFSSSPKTTVMPRNASRLPGGTSGIPGPQSTGVRIFAPLASNTSQEFSLIAIGVW